MKCALAGYDDTLFGQLMDCCRSLHSQIQYLPNHSNQQHPVYSFPLDNFPFDKERIYSYTPRDKPEAVKMPNYTKGKHFLLQTQ